MITFASTMSIRLILWQHPSERFWPIFWLCHLCICYVGPRSSVIKGAACYWLPLKGGRGFDPTSWQDPEGKLEVRKTNAAISPVCLRDWHLPNAPVNIRGWKRGARQLTKMHLVICWQFDNTLLFSEFELRSSVSYLYLQHIWSESSGEEHLPLTSTFDFRCQEFVASLLILHLPDRTDRKSNLEYAKERVC